MKQLMAGGDVALIGITLVPLLSGKKNAYAEYRKLRDEAQELVTAENNLKSLFATVGSEVQHQQGQREEDTKQI